MAALLSVSINAGAVQPVRATENIEYSTVVNPIIPKSVDFAGKKIDLDRIDMYERFDRELTSMIYTHGNTLLTIKRANRYFPMMAKILKANGIPSDMLDRKSVV